MPIQWINQLKPASWRGVKFHADSLSANAGDDVVIREYPFQDLPTFQRMGEGKEEFTIQAYVIGSDYLSKRDALEKVLKGEGVLVHPTRGYIRCWVSAKYRVSENPTAEGGIARFDLTFTRAEARRYPHVKVNKERAAVDSSLGLIRSSVVAFTQLFDTNGAGWVVADAIKQANAVVNNIESVFDGIHTGIDNISSFKRELFGLRNNISSLMSDSEMLATHLESAMGYPDRTNGANTSLKTFKQAFNFTLKRDSSPFNTSSRIQQEGNAQALEKFFQRVVLANAVIALTELEEFGYQDMIDNRAWFLNAIKSQVFTAQTYKLSTSLAEMQTAVIEYMQSRPDLENKVFKYTPKAPQPLIYISYLLYGTIAYADELKANNPHITNPLLAPAGVEMVVINHD